MPVKFPLILATAIFLAAPARAQNAVVSTPTAATQPAIDAPDWQTLVARLGSDNAADREAAQNVLDKLTWREHDALKNLIDHTTQLQAKARLATRLQQIEDRMAYDPPPIALELHNAYLRQLLAELETATGEKFTLGPDGRNLTFSLSAKEGFWEVFRDLNEQHGLTFQYGSGPRISPREPGNPPLYIVGGIAFFAQVHLRGTRGVRAIDAPGLGRPPAILEYSAVAEPRIKVLRFIAPQIVTMRDDAGNNLILPAANNRPLTWTPLSVPPSPFGASVTPFPVARPLGASVTLATGFEKPGKKIAIVQGRLQIAIQVADESVDIANPHQHLNAPIVIGGQTVEILDFTMQDNTLKIRMNRVNEPQGSPPKDPVSFTVLNGAGGTIYSDVLSGTLSANIARHGSNLQAPWSIHMTAPTKVREVTIPFEFKDIPLP